MGSDDAPLEQIGSIGFDDMSTVNLLESIGRRSSNGEVSLLGEQAMGEGIRGSIGAICFAS